MVFCYRDSWWETINIILKLYVNHILHQLKVFDTVAKLNSVTQADHELHMTQPAVSNIIRQLEDYYDCQLI